MDSWDAKKCPEGWWYAEETMAKLDAEGRIWYPDDRAKRPQAKRYLHEMKGAVLGTDIGVTPTRAGLESIP